MQLSEESKLFALNSNLNYLSESDFKEFEYLAENKLIDYIKNTPISEFKKFKNKVENFSFEKEKNKLKDQIQSQTEVDRDKMESLIDKYEKKAQNYGKEVGGSVDGDSPSTSSISEKVKETINNIIEEMKNEDTFSQLGKGLLVLFLVVIIAVFLSALVSAVVAAVLSPLGASTQTILFISQMFVAIFVAPLVEEYGKYVSVEKEATGSYFIGFNIFEFTQYFMGMVFGGFSALTAAAIRGSTVLMHGITTLIIKYNYDKNGKEYTKKQILPMVMSIHAAWNAVAVSTHYFQVN